MNDIAHTGFDVRPHKYVFAVVGSGSVVQLIYFVAWLRQQEQQRDFPIASLVIALSERCHMSDGRIDVRYVVRSGQTLYANLISLKCSCVSYVQKGQFHHKKIYFPSAFPLVFIVNYKKYG